MEDSSTAVGLTPCRGWKGQNMALMVALHAYLLDCEHLYHWHKEGDWAGPESVLDRVIFSRLLRVESVPLSLQRGLQEMVHHALETGWRVLARGRGLRKRTSHTITGSITIKQSSTDSRLKHWVIGIAHRDRDQWRQGAITAILGGKQTLMRAWFFAAVILLKSFSHSG